MLMSQTAVHVWVQPAGFGQLSGTCQRFELITAVQMANPDGLEQASIEKSPTELGQFFRTVFPPTLEVVARTEIIVGQEARQIQIVGFPEPALHDGIAPDVAGPQSTRELDELFTAGFRGAEVNLVEGLIEELDQIETDTDNKQAELRAALYEIEDTLNPVDAVFIYKVIEMTGEIADMAERVGRRLELLLSH